MKRNANQYWQNCRFNLYKYCERIHSISYVESVVDGSRYIIIHSSAAEFEILYNGLYPVENNYFFEKIKIFYYDNQYVRYLDGQAAELFQKMAANLLYRTVCTVV